MRILCLFVRYGTIAHPNALADLDAWYERHGLRERRTLWILDNALSPEAAPQVVAPGVVLRPGDNSAWEFSAWARALREADAEGVEADVVHFVTSAFNTLYTGYLQHFRPGMLDYVVARKVCLGHIDSHPVGFELEGRKFDSWVRTCFFFLSRSVALTVSPWVAYADPGRIFAAPDSIAFRGDAPLSPVYQQHITSWLHGEEIGGHRWHSPVGQAPPEIRRFQQKTLAILNEHGLSMGLRDFGISLVDFCWLESLSGVFPAPSAKLPSEGTQLQIRRKTLGISDDGG